MGLASIPFRPLPLPPPHHMSILRCVRVRELVSSNVSRICVRSLGMNVIYIYKVFPNRCEKFREVVPWIISYRKVHVYICPKRIIFELQNLKVLIFLYEGNLKNSRQIDLRLHFKSLVYTVPIENIEDLRNCIKHKS